MDELGLLGLTLDKSSRAFFATMTYWDDAAGAYRNKIERLELAEDGQSVTDRSVLLDMKDEITVPSYQIQFVSVGPDDLLYVGVGSGANKRDAQDLDKFAGKILRMNKDGSSVPSNPFYDPNAPDSARSYIYAYGLRNPFDLAWDPYTDVAIVSDVGPGIDRVLRLDPGVNYCFEDDENQMRANALYTWGPNNRTGGFAPVGLTITAGDVLTDRPSLYVGLFGSVHVPGPNNGKRVLRFDFNPNGHLESAATDLAVYSGSMFSSVVDVEAGPDGIYFTDLWGESFEPHEQGGMIYRLVPGDPDSVTINDGADLTGRERFEWLLERHRCYACHVLNGQGHVVGPSLTDFQSQLLQRLDSAEYTERLETLNQRTGTFFVEQRPVYEQLQQLDGL